MGKKHKKDHKSLKERIRKLERRLNERNRHDDADYYYARRRTKTKSRSPHRRRKRTPSHSPARTQQDSRSPSTRSSRSVTPRPSCSLTPRPSRSPTPRPSRLPTPRPSRSPTPRPSRSPTPRPSRAATTRRSPSTPLIHENRGGANAEPIPETPVGETIPAEIEGLLGQEGAPGVSNAVALHDGLVMRWIAILQDGLNSQTKTEIMKKHDPPNNCGLLVPPVLNEEVAAALNESAIKRDKRILEQQLTMAAAISAVGKVLNGLICEKSSVQHIEHLSDSARLLCTLYHELTTTRRNLILPGLSKEVKDTLEKTPISEFLFGDKLQDKVNACKAVKKSAQELKNTQPKTVTKPANSLNFRGPQRPQLPRRSGPILKPRQTNFSAKASAPASRPRRSPPKAHPPRRQNHRRR